MRRARAPRPRLPRSVRRGGRRAGNPAPARRRSCDRRSADLQRGRLGRGRPRTARSTTSSELRDELRGQGHRFATEGDTEVIVHLYEEHGIDCVRHLHGMFAFALWDRRRHRLLLARDRIGKKPLFYSDRRGGVSFASELRALLEDRETEREPRPPSGRLLSHLWLRTRAAVDLQGRAEAAAGTHARASRTARSRSIATGALTTHASSR